MDRETLYHYIKNKYRVSPEFPWKRYRTNAVFRHTDNRKWFALVMTVGRDKLGLQSTAPVDVVNLKVDDMFFRDMIIQKEGIMPAYHMNKLHWITVLLDGTVPDEKVYDLLDMSYIATASSKKKEKLRGPKEWIIPANPKYYDIEHAFDDTDEIRWKQGAGIKTGDIVYMYVAAPVSAVLYQCKVLETNIPWDYTDGKLTVKSLMTIKLQKQYPPDRFTFKTLKEDYGIYAVRGPRGVPNSLCQALRKQGLYLPEITVE